MTHPIVYVGRHRIEPGKAEQAHSASADLAQLLESNHPSYLHFQITISDDGQQMDVLQVHSDEASMLLHMQLAGERLAAAYQFLSGTTAIDIYGDPGEELTATIQGMAGDAPLTIHQSQHGFSRLSQSVTS